MTATRFISTNPVHFAEKYIIGRSLRKNCYAEIELFHYKTLYALFLLPHSRHLCSFDDLLPFVEGLWIEITGISPSTVLIISGNLACVSIFPPAEPTSTDVEVCMYSVSAIVGATFSVFPTSTELESFINGSVESKTSKNKSIENAIPKKSYR
jgi:hypothetical protein